MNTPKLGILMLDTCFPRIPGDVGCEETFAFPIVKKIVTGASTRHVVVEGDSALLSPFVQAAQELAEEGVSAITTSCGFLAMFQKELAAAVPVPVFTSSLLQCTLLSSVLREDQVIGILTSDARTLGERHFRGVGMTDVPKVVCGLEGTHFHEVFVGDTAVLDIERARGEMESAARRMVEECPAVGPIVLECTNMPPYAAAVSRAAGRPVYDITTLANYVMDALARSGFSSQMTGSGVT